MRASRGDVRSIVVVGCLALRHAVAATAVPETSCGGTRPNRPRRARCSSSTR